MRWTIAPLSAAGQVTFIVFATIAMLIIMELAQRLFRRLHDAWASLARQRIDREVRAEMKSEGFTEAQIDDARSSHERMEIASAKERAREARKN